ncbi:hypothetical protein COO60DRAFT_1703557 [Scenedesmus sp. NREL 46B-D3]|nr:hypothetical protein COO60DRAFT_1703557 [Scenedesmus sp. NREL 46B-D3]
MASSRTLPDAVITCVLPEYEEKHIWWLVLQYLEDAHFTHTASAFKLELSCKGFKNEFLGLTKVRSGCIAAVLDESPGVAGQLGSNSRPAVGSAQQQQQQQQQQELQLLHKDHDKDGRKQQAAAAAVPGAAAAVPEAAAAAPSPPVLVTRIFSYPEGDDVLDFGDGDDEDTAAAADLEADDDDDEEDHAHTGKAGRGGGTRQQPLSPTAAAPGQHLHQQPGAKPLLRRGREPIPHPPSHPGSPARSSRSRSGARRDSRSRAHSSSMDRSRSPSERRRRSRSRRLSKDSRSRGRGRSGSRDRRRSSSYSLRSRSRSRGPTRSRSRGRSCSYATRSRSRGREYSRERSSRSRSRSRGRRASRSHSGGRGKDGAYHSRSGGSRGHHHHSQYPQQQHHNRQGAGDYHAQGRGGYGAGVNGGPRGRGGRTPFVRRGGGEYDMSSMRRSSDPGAAAAAGSYQPHYQRGRGGRGYDCGRAYDSGRGGRAGYQQRQPGRLQYPDAHNPAYREPGSRDASHEREHDHHDCMEADRQQHEGGTNGRAGDEQQRTDGEPHPQQLASAGSDPSAAAAAAAGGDAAAPAAAAAGEGAAAALHARGGPEACCPNGTLALDSNRANGSRGGGRMGAYPARGRGRGRLAAGGHQPHSLHIPIPAPPPGPPPSAAAAAAGDGAACAGAAPVQLEPGTEVEKGKAGGRYDWPPKDGAAAHTRLANVPAARKLAEAQPTGGGGNGGGGKHRFVQLGAGVGPGRRLSSGILVSGASESFDAPEGPAGRSHAAAAAAAAAGAPGGSAVGIDDRWRGSDDDEGGVSRGRSHSSSGGGAGGRWGSGEQADGRDCRERGGGGGPWQQRNSVGGTGGPREGRGTSPGAVAAELANAAAGAKAAAAAAAAGLVSGAALVAKRKLGDAAAVAITDLSVSHDSPMRGGASPASTAWGAPGSGPQKRARASSPA